jgi:hypothetical protein
VVDQSCDPIRATTKFVPFKLASRSQQAIVSAKVEL